MKPTAYLQQNKSHHIRPQPHPYDKRYFNDPYWNTTKISTNEHRFAKCNGLVLQRMRSAVAKTTEGVSHG